MPDLFARPLGPDGEPTGPMRRVGRTSEFKVRVDPGARDQWEQVEKIVTQPNPYLPGLRPARFLSEYTFTIQPGDEARVMSLFHGGPRWLWEVRLAWGRCTAPPLSRGTAWRDGTYAACQHQLTGPPKYGPVPRIIRPVYPRWYIDLLLVNIRRAYAEHPELFNPPTWLSRDVRTVARDYPPPPPAESPFAVSAEDIWYAANYRNVAGTVLPTWLVDRLGIELTAQRPRPPRTDFMPRYPR